MGEDGAVTQPSGDGTPNGTPDAQAGRTAGLPAGLSAGGAAGPIADHGPDADRGAGLLGLRSGLRELFAAPATPLGRAAEPGRPGYQADGADPGAPSAMVVAPGPEELRKRRISGRRRWYAGSLFALSFLVIAMVQAATSGGSVTSIVAFEALAVVFGVCYVLTPVRVSGGLATAPAGSLSRFAVLALMVAITVPMIVIGGTGVTALWIYVGVAAAIMFPLAWAMVIAVVLAAAMLLTAGLVGDPLPWELALTLVALALWMAGFAGNIRLTIELRETRDELARAAVAAERVRIGRDLHDILGHSLTAIAVKAGLAHRLLERGAPDAAAAAGTEIADVQRLAREALADVRATAAGYRDVSLAGELAVARSVLTAAGIRADLPTAVDDVSPAGRELFGFVVREAVTNIVRHSDARHCSVELTRTSVQITDDGRGSGAGGSRAIGAALAGVTRPGDTARGGGLRGLTERVSAAGGTLVAGPLDGGGFRVTATLPATEPPEDAGKARADVSGPAAPSAVTAGPPADTSAADDPVTARPSLPGSTR